MNTTREQDVLRDMPSACNVRDKWSPVSLNMTPAATYHPGVITAEDPQRTQPVARPEPTRLTPAPRPRTGWRLMRLRTAGLIVAGTFAAAIAVGTTLTDEPSVIPSVVSTTAPEASTPTTAPGPRHATTTVAPSAEQPGTQQPRTEGSAPRARTDGATAPRSSGTATAPAEPAPTAAASAAPRVEAPATTEPAPTTTVPRTTTTRPNVPSTTSPTIVPL